MQQPSKSRCLPDPDAQYIPPFDAKRTRVFQSGTSGKIWMVYDPVTLADVRAYWHALICEVQEVEPLPGQDAMLAECFWASRRVLEALVNWRLHLTGRENWLDSLAKRNVGRSREQAHDMTERRAWAFSEYVLAVLRGTTWEMRYVIDEPDFAWPVTRPVTFGKHSGASAIEALYRRILALLAAHRLAAFPWLREDGVNRQWANYGQDYLYAIPYRADRLQTLLGLEWPDEAETNLMETELTLDIKALLAREAETKLPAGKARGVSLMDAALLLTDDAKDAAKATKKRWQSDPRYLELARKSIGFSARHSQTKLYEPSEILAFIEKVETPAMAQKISLHLRRIAHPVRE